MLKILLIEDNDGDAETVERLLAKSFGNHQKAKQSLKINRCTQLNHALDQLANGMEFDIVLADINLPNTNGFDAIERLRKDYPDMPVIILSSTDVTQNIQLDILRLGTQDFISKNGLNEMTLARSIQYAIERNRLLRTIHEQTRELRANHEEMESFIYITSHDMRSPLVNLKGFTSELHQSLQSLIDILKKRPDQITDNEKEIINIEVNEKIPLSLKFIQSSADKMDRLTDAILQLSRLGRKKLTLELIETNKLVEQCVDSLEHQIRNASAEISFEMLPNIIADRVSIERIFGNILDNSIKYLDPNRPGKILVDSDVSRTHHIFSIQDNGRGITQADCNKVFEIFRRAGDVGHIPGEGMGMAYVKTLVKRHHGEIWFDSAPNKGTTFYFSIDKNLKPERT